MVIEDGKFYFIKDDFFKIFRNYKLISTKYEKYKKILEHKKQKQHKIYNFVFGEVVGKKAVFLIQNLFPTTERYILEKYTTENKDVEIPLRVKKKVIAYSRQVINMAEHGINIPFYNIIEMKDILLRTNS